MATQVLTRRIFALSIALLPFFSSCLNSKKSAGISNLRGDAAGVPIHAALGDTTSEGVTLLASSDATVEGIIICQTSNEVAVTACAAGKGAFMTTALQSTKDSVRIFKANLPVVLASKQQFTLVAFDSAGAKTGLQKIEIKQK